MNERFLTPKEAAEVLSVDRLTVYRWIKNEELPAYRVGKLWRIKESEFNHFIEKKRNITVK